MDLCRSGGHLTSSQVSGFYIKAQERVQAPCTDTCGDGRRLSEGVRLHVVWRVGWGGGQRSTVSPVVSKTSQFEGSSLVNQKCGLHRKFLRLSECGHAAAETLWTKASTNHRGDSQRLYPPK